MLYLSDEFSTACYTSLTAVLNLGDVNADTLFLFSNAARKTKLFWDAIRTRQNQDIPFSDLMANGTTEDELLKLIAIFATRFWDVKLLTSSDDLGTSFLSCTITRPSA